MATLDLTYPKIRDLFKGQVMTGRDESRAFLAWFLENYYRIDELEVQDAICDGSYDKGIDGIYVNEQLNQIDIFQSTLVLTEKTLGDTKLKEFAGTLAQFRDVGAVQRLENSSQKNNRRLADLLRGLNIADLVSRGYTVRGVFITNARRDDNAIELLATTKEITLFDRDELERHFVPPDKTPPISKEVEFDISGVSHLAYDIGSEVSMAIAPIPASALVALDGIVSGELFAWNVRQWLGKRTKVNSDIEKSIKNSDEHRYFPAFHNGLTVLCEKLAVTKDAITVSGYAVVNGCQSLTSLYENRDSITADLRILTKFILVRPDSPLALKITDHTNNQNGTNHRDLQSNTLIQTRLQSEIHRKYPGTVYFRIKRGEHPEWDKTKVIENELAARILLAFDHKDPAACHQAYRLFDDLHSRIFGRPEVDADRIVILHDIYQIATECASRLSDPLFGNYVLTRYLLLYLIREAIEMGELGRKFCRTPSEFKNQPNGMERIRHCVGEVAKTVVRVVDGQYKRRSKDGLHFDYKKELKSSKFVNEFQIDATTSYGINVDSGFAHIFDKLWLDSEDGNV